jgi:hypothetical protein
VALEHIVQSINQVDIDIDNAIRVHSVNVRGFANLPVKVKAR